MCDNHGVCVASVEQRRRAKLAVPGLGNECVCGGACGTEAGGRVERKRRGVNRGEEEETYSAGPVERKLAL